MFIFAGFKVIAEFVLLNLFIGMMLDAFMKADVSLVKGLGFRLYTKVFMNKCFYEGRFEPCLGLRVEG